jgi:hypothetical protein
VVLQQGLERPAALEARRGPRVGQWNSGAVQLTFGAVGPRTVLARFSMQGALWLVVSTCR